MTSDPFAEFKARQREGWKLFAPLAMNTTPPAAQLVRFAGVRPGQRVLDLGCGTGVVAITARRAGATVTGLDLTPELLAVAKENASIAEVDDIVWKEGDAEPAAPWLWGDPNVVAQRLGNAVRDLTFDRGTLMAPALSPQHYRALHEQTAAMVIRVVQNLKDDPKGLARFRREYEELAGQY